MFFICYYLAKFGHIEFTKSGKTLVTCNQTVNNNDQEILKALEEMNNFLFVSLYTKE